MPTDIEDIPDGPATKKRKTTTSAKLVGEAPETPARRVPKKPKAPSMVQKSAIVTPLRVTRSQTLQQRQDASK
jgi:hypothetical protein